MADNEVQIKITAITEAAKAAIVSLNKTINETTEALKKTSEVPLDTDGKVTKYATQSAAGMKAAAKAARDLKGSTSEASGGVIGLAGAFKGFIGLAAAQKVAAIVSSFENLKRMMVGLFGDTEKAGQQFEYLTKTAMQLGVDVEGLTKGYTLLAAATRGTSLEGAATQKIFSAFAGAMAQMGASTADVEGAMVQLSQGIGKGKFELEDVKSIMERIPGSAKIFADSLGITTTEFYNMISAGQLGHAEVEKMATGLEKVYGKDAEIKGLSQSWNNFVTQLKLAVTSVNEATGAGGALSGVMGVLSKAVEGVSATITIGAAGFSFLGKAIGETSAAVANSNFDDLGKSLRELANETTQKAGSALSKLFLGYDINAKRAAGSQKEATAGMDAFRSSVLDGAQAYTKAATATTNAVAATKEYGAAQVSAAQGDLSRAQATGTFNDVLQAKANLEMVSARTAQENAVAAQQQVDQTQKRVDAVKNEIATLSSKKAATDAEAQAQAETIQKLKDEQIELDKLQPKQIAQAANLAALSIAQGEAARQTQATSDAMRNEGAGYDTLFAKQQQALQFLTMLKTAKADSGAADAAYIALQTQLIDLEQGRAEAMQGTAAEQEAYNAKVAEAQAAMDSLNAVLAGGAGAEQALAAATDASAAATANATAALQARQVVEQQQQQASQQQLDLDLKNNDLKQIEIQSRIAVAKARGNEYEVQRLQGQASRLEIDRINATIAAKAREVQAFTEKVKLAKMEADLDGTRTATEKRMIALAEQKLAIVKAEQAALQASANGKRAVLAATEAARESEARHGAQAKQTAADIRTQVGAKQEVNNVTNIYNNGSGGGSGSASPMALGGLNSGDLKNQEAKDLFDQLVKTKLNNKSFASTTEALNAAKEVMKQVKAFDESITMEAKKKQEIETRDAARQQRDSSTTVQPTKTVRFELASPSGKTFSVDAVGGSEDQLSGWLASLASGKGTAQ